MAIDVAELEQLVRSPARLPRKFESSYDREADVLYVRFEQGSADHSDLTDDDVVVRFREGRLIGVTVLNASKRPGLHLE